MSPLDFKKTIFLPQTAFPMRGNLPQKEQEILAFWDKIDLYAQLRKMREKDPLFVLHDGPPYANGHLHVGHAFNKIFKDAINRTQAMAGKNISYIPGWDCHGLPIEAKVEEQYRKEGLSKREIPPLAFRQACRAFAQKWLDIQKAEFQRLGILGDWQHPYTTMSFSEEAGIAQAFLDIFMRGDIYRGTKPVLWSVVEETALAEAEVVYKDVTSPAIDVCFPITQSPIADLQKDVAAVIWTTTPWTLPANRAIAYGPHIHYVLIQVTTSSGQAQEGEKLLIAKDLLELFIKRTGIQAYHLLHTFSGSELQGTRVQHPLYDQGYTFDVPFLPGAHVTTDTGTGLVHTAPSHGLEDFTLGLQFNLDIPETIGPSGLFLETVPLFAGAHVYKANPLVIQALQEGGRLRSHVQIEHSYPHSWRSQKPLIYRATPQWFLAMDGVTNIRKKAMAAIETVTWVPESGKKRIQSMVENRPDWCLSRQRIWGVPLPLFIHRQTGEPLKNEKVNQRIKNFFEAEGADAWWKRPADDFLLPEFDPTLFEKTGDILDVWFDSGVTHEFVVKKHHLRTDLCLEGSDQHRGWFQTALLTAVALGKEAPYKTVLTHGFVMDGVGQKMSKSQGNILSPQEVIASQGADILRLWALLTDFQGDVRIGPALLKHVGDLYRRFRNTLRYLLGSLVDFSYTDHVPQKAMPELERWMLHRLETLERDIQKAFQENRFQWALQELHTFCSNDLSAFYFDVRKNVLYCDSLISLDRRATQTIFAHLLQMLLRLLAPILVFTTEEAWQVMRKLPCFLDLPESVHLSSFPSPQCQRIDEPLADHYASLRNIRQVITGALEEARAQKTIGSPLEACPAVYLSPNIKIKVSQQELLDLALTSDLLLFSEHPPENAFTLPDQPDVGVVVQRAQGQKCERCWTVRPEVTPSLPLCRRCQKVLDA